MAWFRKKPVEVEARQWDGTAEGATPIIDWILTHEGTARYTCSDPHRCAEHDGDTPHHIAIDTLEGTMRADFHDWVIQGVKGEFYPCKPDIFEATYEAAGDQVIGEAIHVVDGVEHPVSQCSPEVCGREPGEQIREEVG